MLLSAVLTLILVVVFAATDAFALLIKRDSTTSMTSTASTASLATPLVLNLALTSTVDSPSFQDTSTTPVTVNPLAATDSSAPSQSLSDGDYMIALRACNPLNATRNIDFNAPCNQVGAIGTQCLYGPRALELLSLRVDSDS